MPYGPPSSQTPFTPSPALIPTAPTITGVADGVQLGEVLVTVATPIVAPPITQVVVFYSVLDISTETIDQLFDEDPNRVGNKVTSIGPTDTSVVVDITGLAAGKPYFFRAARSNGP